MRLKWFVVLVMEYSGYDCSGHEVPHIVAAENEEQALTLVSYEEWYNGKPIVKEFVLPDLKLKKKPFELEFWKIDKFYKTGP